MCNLPQFPHKFNIVEVDIGSSGGVDHLKYSIHREWSQQAGVLGHHLHTSVCEWGERGGFHDGQLVQEQKRRRYSCKGNRTMNGKV